MAEKSINITISGVNGYPSWLRKVIEFAIVNKVDTWIHYLDSSNQVTAVFKIRSEAEEQKIKQQFPFKAEFNKEVKLLMGGTVLVARWKVNST